MIKLFHHLNLGRLVFNNYDNNINIYDHILFAFILNYIKIIYETMIYLFRRSLGGKLGQQLENKFKIEFMSQLVPIPLSDLQRLVGPKNG